jgi:holo-[acyl-carrier protein] synthase
MEIVAIGSAIVECLRVRRMIERHGEAFLRRAFTDREISACQASRRSTEQFSGRWAAKEAVLKCLGLGAKEIDWTELEVRQETAGPPRLLVRGAAKERARRQHIGDVLLTIAYCRAYATATVIAVKMTNDQTPMTKE